MKLKLTKRRAAIYLSTLRKEIKRESDQALEFYKMAEHYDGDPRDALAQERLAITAAYNLEYALKMFNEIFDVET